MGKATEEYEKLDSEKITDDDEEEEEEEPKKWRRHYSSRHIMLLVRDGKSFWFCP